ncbi:MAG: hypothetical protein ABR976_07100 [Terracidiphilus sp.]|jgi:hypothetical protein
MANTNHSTTAARLLALLVASLLLFEPAVPLRAEALPEGAPPASLQIAILDGDGALNNIQERTAREPIVQVQDENHKPVAGAAVLFAIHGAAGGAGGAFAGGASTLSVVTDANGVAKAVGLATNHLQGNWQIQVTATKGNLTTSTTINEQNVTPSPQGGNQPNQTPTTKPPFHWPISKGLTIAAGVVVAGVVIGIVAAQNNNNGTTITTGNGTVGAPTSGAVRAGIRIHF